MRVLQALESVNLLTLNIHISFIVYKRKISCIFFFAKHLKTDHVQGTFTPASEGKTLYFLETTFQRDSNLVMLLLMKHQYTIKLYQSPK
jgi:hypothetical protein